MTSSPTIVTSSPEWKTRSAASGSAQTLNSAAGVMFPSAIAPPISTIRRAGAIPRSSEQRDVRERPERDERTVSGVTCSARKSTALWATGSEARCGGAPARRGRSRRGRAPRRASSRVSGRSAPAATGTSSRPDEREHVQRVVGRLLERLVAVHGRDAEQLDLGACQRQQERDRVVVARIAVDDDRVVTRRVSRLARPPSAGKAARRSGRPQSPRPRRRGAGPPRASRPSSSETSRQAVNASPAAVPSTASTAGGSARATSSPSSSSTAPSAPSVSATRPSRRAERLELVAVDDGEVGVDVDRPRGRGVEAEEPGCLLPGAEHGLVGDLELGRAPRRSARARRRRAPRSRPARPTIWFSPLASTRISATPVGTSTRRGRERQPFLPRRAPRRAKTSVPTEQTSVTSAPRRAQATAWFAPLPPGTRANVAPVTVSPARGRRSTRATRSRLTVPTTVIRTHVPRAAGPRAQAASARRSSTVEPSSVSRRSNRPAQSDDAIRRRVESRGVGEALQGADEHRELEVRRRRRGRARRGRRRASSTGFHSTSSPRPGPEYQERPSAWSASSSSR